MPLLVAALAAAFPALRAQTAPAPSRAAAPAAETVELSPFVIAASAETGYAATSSLAGSRLKTDLKDIASQIDVLTPEFLQDIAATNLAEAVAFSTNVGAAPQQNIGPNDGVDSTRSEARARGFDAATLSSDFFPTGFPSDLYNVDRITIANGPQSILFGLGTAGGVLDLATKRALLRPAASAELRLDNRGSLRGVLDFNQPLAPGVLAFRVAAVHSDTLSAVKGGFNTQRRIYSAFTWHPFASATFRVHYEHLDQRVSTATNFISQDYVSPWWRGGRPLLDNSRGNAAVTNATDPYFNRNTNTLTVFSYGDTAPAGSSSLLVWNGSAVTKGPHQLAGAADDRDASLLDGGIYPLDRDPRVNSRLNHIYGDQLRFFWEQQVARDLFFEIGANNEHRHELSGGTFNNGESINLFGDPNQYLPGGTAAAPRTTPNPNAGRLYIETFPNGNERDSLTREARFTGSGEFDFAKKFSAALPRRLGRHRLALLLSYRADEDRSQQDRAVIGGNPSFVTGDRLNASRFVRARYYFGDTLSAGPLPGGTDRYFGPWTFTHPATGEPYPVYLFNNPDGRAFAPNGNRTAVATQMLAAQSYFLGDRLNTFYGLRRDAVTGYDLLATDTVRRDFRAAGDRQGLYLPVMQAAFSGSPTSEETGLSQTLGAVLHLRPWLSLHYSKSENFALPPGYLDPEGRALPGTFSNGQDCGVRFSFLENRFSARLNFYTETQNANVSGTIQNLRDYAALVESRLRGPDRPAGLAPIAPDGFDPVARGADAYRAVEDKRGKGLDFVLVGNLTRQWDLRLAVGYQRTNVTDKALAFRSWIARRLPVWQNAGGLGWANVTVSPTDSRSLRDYYTNVILPEATSLELLSGQDRFRQRPWRTSLFTNRRFDTGPLKGFGLGGGFRWLDRAQTGFARTTVPGTGLLVEDKSRRYFAGRQSFIDAVASYTRTLRLAGKNLRWRAQLNVNNLLAFDDLEVLRAKYDGTPLDVGRAPTRQIVFSNRLSF